MAEGMPKAWMQVLQCWLQVCEPHDHNCHNNCLRYDIIMSESVTIMAASVTIMAEDMLQLWNQIYYKYERNYITMMATSVIFMAESVTIMDTGVTIISIGVLKIWPQLGYNNLRDRYSYVQKDASIMVKYTCLISPHKCYNHYWKSCYSYAQSKKRTMKCNGTE